MRVLSFVVMVTVVLGTLLAIPRRSNRVAACSIAPSMFENEVKRAGLILLADASDVGGGENSAPTLTPTLTPPPPETATRDPSATRTSRPTISVTATPAAPSSTPPHEPPARPELVGQRATLDVVQVYIGQPEPRFVIDGSARASYERELRGVEAGFRSPCGPWPAARYVEGGRYLVLVGRSTQGDYITYRRLRVEGDDIALHEDVYGSQYVSGLQMQGVTYRRYFAGVAARIDQGTDYDYATITADRLPLMMLVHAITDIRNGTSIAPPETGNAGLAASP